MQMHPVLLPNGRAMICTRCRQAAPRPPELSGGWYHVPAITAQAMRAQGKRARDLSEVCKPARPPAAGGGGS